MILRLSQDNNLPNNQQTILQSDTEKLTHFQNDTKMFPIIQELNRQPQLEQEESLQKPI